MEKVIISTNNAPAAIGPYSQAVRLGNLVFTSGQIPLNPETGELVSSNIRDAARQSLENLKAVLIASGTSLENVVKTVVFLKDMNDFAAANEVYSQFFTDKMPARSAIQAGRLPKDSLIEIEAVAFVPEE